MDKNNIDKYIKGIRSYAMQFNLMQHQKTADFFFEVADYFEKEAVPVHKIKLVMERIESLRDEIANTDFKNGCNACLVELARITSQEIDKEKIIELKNYKKANKINNEHWENVDDWLGSEEE